MYKRQVYLLCSDGLTDMVDDSQIQLILSMPDISLDSRAQSLIQLANEHGGKDNISVILVPVSYTHLDVYKRQWMLRVSL